MATLAPGSSPFALIRSAIVNRVATAINSYIPTDPITHLPLAPAWVRPVANDDYEVTATENWFACIRTYGPSPIDAKTGAYLSEQGAGRLSVNVSRRIRVYLYSRAGMDIVGGDEVSLGGLNNSQTINSASWPGVDILEELVLNALINWVPIFTDPNTMIVTPLTLGPVHWLDSPDGPAVRPPENEVGLLRSHLDFGVTYILTANQGDPAPVTLPIPINNPV